MCELTADDIVRQGQSGARANPALTLTEARKQLEALLGPEGFATLEQVESLQVLCGISQRTFYNLHIFILQSSENLAFNQVNQTAFIPNEEIRQELTIATESTK